LRRGACIKGVVGCVIVLCMSNCEEGVSGAVLMRLCLWSVGSALSYMNVVCVKGILNTCTYP
jgi:hypothetical protein